MPQPNGNTRSSRAWSCSTRATARSGEPITLRRDVRAGEGKRGDDGLMTMDRHLTRSRRQHLIFPWLRSLFQLCALALLLFPELGGELFSEVLGFEHLPNLDL
jgi:hypothetical protein